jgi:hypothetical protein
LRQHASGGFLCPQPYQWKKRAPCRAKGVYWYQVEAENYDDLLRYLKEFANLLEVLFTQGCPLWRIIHDAIEKLMDYTSEERAALHQVSCNAILWIVMCQARVFAAGEMPEPDNANAAFTAMMLRINIRGQIEFGGLPATMKSSQITQ